MKVISVLFKIVVVLLLLVVLAGVVLYSMGSKTFKYESKVEIEDSTLEVFPFLHVPPLLETWMNDVEKVDVIDENGKVLTDKEGNRVNAGTDLPGTRKRIVLDMDGTEFIMENKVDESSHRNYILYSFTSDMMVGKLRFDTNDVRNEDDLSHPHTEVVETLEVQFVGPYRIMAMYFDSVMPQALEAELQKLKEVVEEGTALQEYNDGPQRFADLSGMPKEFSDEELGKKPANADDEEDGDKSDDDTADEDTENEDDAKKSSDED